MRKRVFSTIIALVFMLSILSPVAASAQTTISQEKAIEIIKNLFDTSIYDQFNINYNETDYGKNVWELNWSQSKETYGSLSANVDSDTGNILSIYMYRGYDSGRTTSGIPKYTKNQALEIAQNYAKKIQPSEFAKTKLTESKGAVYPTKNYSESYFFNFIRTEGNIPVENNYINVEVDGYTGDILSYSFNWCWDPLPSAANLILPEDAEKIFKTNDKLGLKLVYKRYFDYSTKKEDIKLVYVLNSERFLIDAVTGEIIDDRYYDFYGAGAGEKSAQAGYDTSLTPAESKEVEITKNCISKDEAINIVKDYVTIPSDYKQKTANLYEIYDDPGQKIWNISWQKTDENGDISGTIYASVNALTKELLSFDIYDDSRWSQEFKQNYDRSAAQKKAEEFLQNFQPSRFKNVKLEDIDTNIDESEKAREHYFVYTRIVNGIPYNANGFNLTVDSQSGQIVSYRMDWHERVFPDPTGVIPKDKAQEQFLKKVGLELVYAYLYNPKEGDVGNYKLVYKPKDADSYTFDAFDFTPLDYSGKPVKEEVETSFTDIKGHWAEKDIQLLIDLGVIKCSEDKFLPDKDITEGEFVKFLLLAKNQNIPDDALMKSSDADDIQPYIDLALKLGWIKPNEIDAKRLISREKAAALVVRAMGLEKAASLSDIYKDIAADSASITADYKGHVTLALGLKLMSCENGKFSPGGSVTRAEAAAILVRMLRNQ